ncbi:glycosyltransferase family 4 protein [Geomesophilobacter sediminis]|uniref:Glycosyltransferase family 4 protein n=1 Tax=Geomesophilobacter sediminis TaxID=2798584 RepID=A0A8J7JE07_9BACT|nr:glycosyltransferase family 4 protein [Geomesophilobacter sediminis]MBJ6724074.1 glycosyltransferase family 4 protein [Geomesophilobacter sediminis]
MEVIKVLLLNTLDDAGGAARAASRLLTAVREVGVDAQMLVRRKRGDLPGVIGPATAFTRFVQALRPHLDALPVRLYPNSPYLNFAPAMVPDLLVRKVEEINPDIIHLHWIAGGFLQLETLRRLRKPLVWTLHDSWAFTGGCHVPFECTSYREKCGKCPILGSSREVDLSRRVWARKERALHDLPINVVAPSRWMASCAEASSLFREKRIVTLPNGVDEQLFRPIAKDAAREMLSLPQGQKLICFGAMSARDRNKGFHLLASALRELAARWGGDAQLVVFGSLDRVDAVDLGIRTTYRGRIDDDSELALLYAAADVFVLPSLMENLPYAVMEAMACGTPCVAFDQGGVPDLIEPEINGYLARCYEPEDLAKGIAWVLEDNERHRGLSQRARKKVEDEFALSVVAGRYLQLYETVLHLKERSGGDWD